MRLLPLALALPLAGCFPDSTYQCDMDPDCSGGEVCARTHECLAPAEVRAVRVKWTIEGMTDAAAACSTLLIGDLTIAFTASSDQSQDLSFAPVPCSGGAYPIDKLPTRFDQVELYGYDDVGTRYDGITIVGSDPEYTVAMTGN